MLCFIELFIKQSLCVCVVQLPCQAVENVDRIAPLEKSHKRVSRANKGLELVWQRKCVCRTHACHHAGDGEDQPGSAEVHRIAPAMPRMDFFFKFLKSH